MLFASPCRLALAGRIGHMLIRHLSPVLETGEVSTIPSGYWLVVHPTGVAYTYSPSVAEGATFACARTELPTPEGVAEEAGAKGRSPRIARASMASILGRFLETRSARVASTAAAT